MPSVELTNSWEQLGLVVVSSALMLVGIIAVVRVIGLRSFSKMSSFDFAVTVATGSLLASVALSQSALVDGVVAVATLLGVQALIAVGRQRIGLTRVVDNKPLLLMAGPEVLHENLRQARITTGDLRAKLRENGVLHTDQVRYVVLETTGNVSVLHGDGPIDRSLLDDVTDGHLVPG